MTIAADDDPASDPWRAEPTDTTIDVAAGDYAELVADGRFSAAAALRVAVDAVRTALARNACRHESADESIGAHCPTCGVRLSDATDWRWTTT